MTVVGSWSTIEVEIDGDVAQVRFNRPEQRNSVTTTMVAEMYEVLSGLSRDPSLSVVVLTGNGTAFCPGADLGGGVEASDSDVRHGSEDDSAPELPDRSVYHSARLLHEMPQVTVAAVNGGCAGAGMAWASACDLRVASTGARFNTAFLEVGLAGELGLAWTLQRLLGGAAARELCLLPRKLSAEDLHAMGYLNRVFPAESFRQDADAFATALAARGRAALRAMKANFVDAGNLSLGDYINRETRRHHAFFRPGG